ncbi:hypothetical protein U1763_06655 [Sphingomonas sp. LB2R24]
MSDPQRKALDAAVHKGAENGCQYRYETIRVADGVGARVANPDLLTLFAS